ncbi:AP endonuclease, protein [Acrodontium crateriforme]|uniref:Apurinic-apyrimidinic endonuclease 1 n=1 Tax=Acrodontium crateriforme TaxID=150365 RepID=A0AAQ3R990_9PEZI|nr:AP endonuclease, protein [Acrodontium crateriforme]
MAPSVSRSRTRSSLPSSQTIKEEPHSANSDKPSTKKRKLSKGKPSLDHSWVEELPESLRNRSRELFELSNPITLEQDEYDQIWPHFSQIWTTEESSTPKRGSMHSALRYQCLLSPQKLLGLRKAFGASVDGPTNITMVKRGKKGSLRYEFSTSAKEGAVAASKTTKSKAATVKGDSKKALNVEVEVEEKAKPTRKRKTPAEKEAEAEPLAARTQGHPLYIGAHISSAGGVQNSVANSVHIGANAFALFLKSQRKWANPPLAADACSGFHDNCKKLSYDQSKHVVPHGSYLVNLAHTDVDRTEQAYAAFLDDLQRCEKLGITLYNFHPGNSVGGDRAKAIAHIAKSLNRAHKATSTVVTLLENMAAGGNVIGSTFEDLRDIIALIEDKSRVGVCIDTCHAFAGGYDLRTPEAFKHTMDEFERIVGFKYLRAMHLNDSKAPFSSHRDLHANIGTGFIGLRGFHCVVNEPRFAGLPLVLETPLTVVDDNGEVIKDEKSKEKEDKGIWAREIKLLESLVGMDTESEEYLDAEMRLSKRGEPERKRLMEQHERKVAKDKNSKPKKGKKRKVSDSDEEDDEDDE